MARIPEKIVTLLEGGHAFWVATASADGWPNIAIKGSGAVADPEHLFFADLFSKKTRVNLEHNPLVAVAIHDAEKHIAVQVKGRATLSESGPLYDTVVARLAEKAPSLPKPKYVVEIAVESVWDMTAGPNAGERIA
ncbi:MAG: pyridoxamine 5'-phosphate oxidase family protein [Capsulimonadaceae bacterium]|nr:pyridoxamine 5'-phosphate oxidase family protein [Capsulimonadaceae bacterium]